MSTNLAVSRAIATRAAMYRQLAAGEDSVWAFFASQGAAEVPYAIASTVPFWNQKVPLTVDGQGHRTYTVNQSEKEGRCEWTCLPGATCGGWTCSSLCRSFHGNTRGLLLRIAVSFSGFLPGCICFPCYLDIRDRGCSKSSALFFMPFHHHRIIIKTHGNPANEARVVIRISG